jgi:hypothetical protein
MAEKHEYTYVAWFRNPKLSVDDQDCEWPACFVLISETETSAESWGNQVSERYARRTGSIFLKSYIDRAMYENTNELPKIDDGHFPKDSEIGW